MAEVTISILEKQPDGSAITTTWSVDKNMQVAGLTTIEDYLTDIFGDPTKMHMPVQFVSGVEADAYATAVDILGRQG